MMIKRGDVFFADLNPVVGSEESGIRPVLVVQNDIGNRYSPTVIVAAVTSKLKKPKLPTHIQIEADETSLPQNSMVLAEQIRTLDKKRLKQKVGQLSIANMHHVDEALQISLGFVE